MRYYVLINFNPVGYRTRTSKQPFSSVYMDGTRREEIRHLLTIL